MYANLLDEPGPASSHPLRWGEITLPEPGPGQVLIQVVACGVCRSNLHMIEGDWAANGVPAFSSIIPGHEVTGYVAQVGQEVTQLAVGDPVGVQPLWTSCETCEFCLSGREQLCHERLITGEHVDGGYGQYMLANAAHAYRVPDGLDLVDAAPLFCPGITAYGAVDKLQVGPGERVAIFGLGGVGHMAVQFAALTGAEVIAVGRNPEHLAVAGELGASVLVDSRDPEQLAAIEETAQAVLTFAPADAVTEQALRTLKRGGTLVSMVPLTIKSYPFDRAQTFTTSVLGNREQMRRVLELAAQGKLRTIIERYPMEQASEVLELLSQGKVRSRAVLYNA